MISGRTPHEGNDPRSILRSVLNDEPPRLGQLVQGLPSEVEDLVHGMLAKDPGERTASAGFVVRQIDGVLTGAPGVETSGSRGRLIAVAAPLRSPQEPTPFSEAESLPLPPGLRVATVRRSRPAEEATSRPSRRPRRHPSRSPTRTRLRPRRSLRLVG